VYGCETWSLSLREENRLRVFENRVLSRIFGPKREEVAEEWRRLHNEEFHKFYKSRNIVRMIKSLIEDIKYVFRILVGESEGKRPLGRPRHRWENNIRIYL
jgi:hypothetical protein